MAPRGQGRGRGGRSVTAQPGPQTPALPGGPGRGTRGGCLGLFGTRERCPELKHAAINYVDGEKSIGLCVGASQGAGAGWEGQALCSKLRHLFRARRAR